MTRCTYDLRREGKAHPRTCAECGLGPCKYQNKEPIAMTPSPKERAEAETRPIVDRIALYVGCMFYEDAHNPIALKLAEIFAPTITAALLAAEVKGMRRAEVLTGTMAERPYDNEPEFSAVLHVESAIRAAADELEKQAKEIAP